MSRCPWLFTAALPLVMALILSPPIRAQEAGGARPTPPGSKNAAAPGTSLRPYAPGTPQYGKGGTPEEPSVAVLRQDEDWSWLREVPEEERRPIDALKYISLNPDGSTYLSFALNAHARFEHFDDQSWGDFPGGDGAYHFRVNPHISLTMSERVRLYGALKFGQVEDLRFFAPPVEDDGPDVHQAFAELSFGDWLGLGMKDAFVRVGRQELHYGGGRLLSIRGGPNVRRDFDTVLLRARLGSTVGDAFLARPTEDKPGVWNNGSLDGDSIWGVTTSTALAPFVADQERFLASASLDLLYFGQRRAESDYAFLSAPVSETRHTLGVRAWTTKPPTAGLGYDLEGTLQFGSASGANIAADTDILAWSIAGIGTYGIEDVAWKPILRVRAGVTSGDEDSNDDRIGTFRGLFPPGRYFGEGNPLGPGNITGIGGYLDLTPTDRLTLSPGVQAFWRVEGDDGVYSPGQTTLRPPNGGGSYLGNEYSVVFGYRLTDWASLSGRFAHFDTSDFVNAGSPSEDITYGDFEIRFEF